MYITEMTLTDYVLLKGTDIEYLKIEFDAPVQIIIGTNGGGKAQPLDSLIKTPGGFIRMEDISIGSLVTTPDGGSSAVTGIYPQGEQKVYRITFDDGRSTECSLSHLWKVYDSSWPSVDDRWNVLPLKDIKDQLRRNKFKNKLGFFIPLVEHEIKEDINLPIHPYLLGILFNPNTYSLLTDDKNIKDVIENSFGKDVYKSIDDLSVTDLSNKEYLMKLMYQIYTDASLKQKIHFIQGLMDTNDGVAKSVVKRFNDILLIIADKDVAEQFQKIIWSIGGICDISYRDTSCLMNVRYKQIKDLFCNKFEDDKIIINQHSTNIKLRIKDIEYVGVKEVQCITIDHPDHLYITDDYIVTHNSSTLRMLSPYPSSRSLFDKNGYKSLKIEHNGSIYTLESDYSKPSSPHLFYKGDNEDNLNIGRTTETQKDLLIEHLGITPLVDDLIMNRQTFPRWTPSKRKEFIMAINPDQIGFVLTLLKQTSSKIKSCKSNIQRLQSRKIVLEQSLLKEEDLNNLNLEKIQIQEELGMFQQYLMDISVGLRSLLPESDKSVNVEYLINKTKAYRYALSSLSDVERDDHNRKSDRDKIISDIGKYDQKLNDLDKVMNDTVENLSKAESHYKELSVSDEIDDIDITITNLESQRDKLMVSKPIFEVDKIILDKLYQEWDTLKYNLEIFSNLSIPLYRTKKRNHRKQLLENLLYKKSSLVMKQSEIEDKLQTLQNRNTLSISDIPTNPCSKEKCPLYTHFLGEYQSNEESKLKYNNILYKVKHKLKRINVITDGLQNYFVSSDKYHDQIQWIITYANTNPILHRILKSMDILTVLKNNPNLIIINLKNEYDMISQWHSLKSIENDLEISYNIKKAKISSESEDTISLVVSIEKYKKSLYDLRSEFKSISSKRYQKEKMLENINLFDTTKVMINDLKKVYIDLSKVLLSNHEHEVFNELKKTIETLRSDRLSRLGSIEKVLRDQNDLSSRYTQEVVSELNIIEKEKEDLEQIEKALIAIPKESTIDFLNAIFDQANKIIESVWTVPLKIELLTYENVLNYEFYISGSNMSLREMSDCSDGQNEIISLAINLAIRIYLGHLNLPLCLDEPGRTFDTTHNQNLVAVLKKLLEDCIISQLFVVSHYGIIHESFNNTQTFVISPINIFLPPEGSWNNHVVMK